MVSGGRRRHSQFAVATYTQPSGFSVANCRHVIGCRSKPDSRQVALYAFKMPAIYEKGFVPYTYTAVGTNPLVEIFPGTRVGWVGRISSKIFQVVEASPIVNRHDIAPPHPFALRAQQFFCRILLQGP